MDSIALAPPPDLIARVSALLGVAVTGGRPVAGGYTHAARWRLTLADGGAVFAKLATDEATAGWLRAEWRIYGTIEAPWLARVAGWQDGPRPVLLLEDLSGARWPPPWTPRDVERVLAATRAISETPPPAGLSRLVDARASLRGWPTVADDPAPFLGLGLADEAWLRRNLPTLVQAEAAARLDGDQLCHLDLRSDNLCFVGERAVVVDWNWATVGNPQVDVAFWLPSLRAEGGPPPGQVLPDAPELAAQVSGFFAAAAGLPIIPHAPRVRAVQRTQLEAALPWACEALGLEPPGAR